MYHCLSTIYDQLVGFPTLEQQPVRVKENNTSRGFRRETFSTAEMDLRSTSAGISCFFLPEREQNQTTTGATAVINLCQSSAVYLESKPIFEVWHIFKMETAQMKVKEVLNKTGMKHLLCICEVYKMVVVMFCDQMSSLNMVKRCDQFTTVPTNAFWVAACLIQRRVWSEPFGAVGCNIPTFISPTSKIIGKGA